tara:strand:- start:6218 stop:6505 length:288 start_codon:yes stop_codon:yes gene_type:complete
MVVCARKQSRFSHQMCCACAQFKGGVWFGGAEYGVCVCVLMDVFEKEFARTAVSRGPAHRQSRQSPTLLTTEVLGMRYLKTLHGLTEMLQSSVMP